MNAAIIQEYVSMQPWEW